jgi:2'-5' RNA ligase
MTIGRWRQGDRAGKTLEHELQRWSNYEFGISQADEVILFQSVLKPSGAIYSRLKVIALKHDGQGA